MEWADERTVAPELPWFVDAVKVSDQGQPLRLCQAIGRHRLTVYVCEVLDGALSPASVGAFHRVWDRGLALTHDRAAYVRKLLGLLLPGARALTVCAAGARELQDLCGALPCSVRLVGGASLYRGEFAAPEAPRAGAEPPPPPPGPAESERGQRASLEQVWSQSGGMGKKCLRFCALGV